MKIILDMSSIKDYCVSSVVEQSSPQANETQVRFLYTIKSNVKGVQSPAHYCTNRSSESTAIR